MGVGLTASAGAVAVWGLWVETAFLHPYWRVVVADYGGYLAAYGAMALGWFGVGVYALARVAGLGAVGRKVDVAERTIRRGGQDAALAEALARDEAGDYS